MLSIRKIMPRKLRTDCTRLGTIQSHWLVKMSVHHRNVSVTILTKCMTTSMAVLERLNARLATVNA